MKYPITLQAGGFTLRRTWALPSLSFSEAAYFIARHWGLLAALAITFFVHVATLRYYFDGDDFVVLGSIRHSGPGQYMLDTLLMHDIVPNWRPLTGFVYAVEWQLFGLDATWWRLVNLAVHLGSLALLYALALRLTRRPAIGAIAALLFGVSGAHFDTVTYVTALPHVLGTFFTLASLLVLVAYVQDGERSLSAYSWSVALFALAFLANEGSFVYAIVLVAAYALLSRRGRLSPLRLVLHIAPFSAIATSWFVFYETCDCSQLKFDGYYWGPHVFTNYAVYFSWIAYPAQLVPHSPDALRWGLASAVLVFLVAAMVLGPNIARITALGVVLSLLPFVPVSIWTASRYSYGAVAFFALPAALALYAAFDWLRETHRFVRLPVTVLALLFVAAVASLYSWQTVAQDARSGRGTERWALLVSELRRNYENLPAGSTIYIVDGPWTNPMEQVTWMPSVARAVYGDVSAQSMTSDNFRSERPGMRNAIFLTWEDGRLRPLRAHEVVAPSK